MNKPKQNGTVAPMQGNGYTTPFCFKEARSHLIPVLYRQKSDDRSCRPRMNGGLEEKVHLIGLVPNGLLTSIDWGSEV